MLRKLGEILTDFILSTVSSYSPLSLFPTKCTCYHPLPPLFSILNNFVFEKLQLQKLPIIGISTAVPGAVPSHNHLSCMLIPAMIKAHDFQERWPVTLLEVSWLNPIDMGLYVPACNISSVSWNYRWCSYFEGSCLLFVCFIKKFCSSIFNKKLKKVGLFYTRF